MSTGASPAMVPAAPVTHWGAVGAALLAGVVGGLAFGKVSPALPELKPELGLSLVQAGWVVATFNAMAAAAAIFFGIGSDRLGALRFCLAGLACLCVGGLIGAFAQGPWPFIAARVFEGIGFMAVIVSAPALITVATAPTQRSQVFGMWSSYMPFGAGVALASSALLLPFWGWRGMWLAIAAAAGLCAWMLWSQRAHYAAAVGARRSLAAVRAVLSRPVPWWLGIAFAMYAVQNHAILIWLPTYLVDVRGTTTSTAALLTALAITANCLGNYFGGWLIQRGFPRGPIIAITFCATATLFVLIFAGGLPDGVRYALVVLYNIVCGPIPAAALSGGARYARSPDEVGSIQGLIVQITQIGIFLGPPVTAVVVSAAGSWEATLWVVLTVGAVGFCAALVVMRLERRAA